MKLSKLFKDAFIGHTVKGFACRATGYATATALAAFGGLVIGAATAPLGVALGGWIALSSTALIGGTTMAIGINEGSKYRQQQATPS